MKIFTRYDLISFIISDNYLPESMRGNIAKISDEILFTSFGKQQFKEIRKGYYILN